MSSDVSGGVTDTYSYDAEGRMIAAYEGGVLQAAYDYDAYGQQVSKTEGSATIHLIHDPFGRLIAEHDPGSSPGQADAILQKFIRSYSDLFRVSQATDADFDCCPATA